MKIIHILFLTVFSQVVNAVDFGVSSEDRIAQGDDLSFTSNIVIPILEDSKINKIHNWMIEANKALHESRQLLEQAKHEVEEMIESATK